MKLTHFSLFTGIGGIDLAAEWAGFTSVGQCEIDDYANKVLEKHWPDVPRWKDIFELKGADIIAQCGKIDLLSGGFPCQPFSTAGKRKGDTDERHLWPELLRVIREVKPKWFMGENVRGLLSIKHTDDDRQRVFGSILRDLAESGYRVGWICYGAGDVGAPHRRERVFILAHAARDGNRRKQWERGLTVEVYNKIIREKVWAITNDGDTSRSEEVANTPQQLLNRSRQAGQTGRGKFTDSGELADTNHAGGSCGRQNTGMGIEPLGQRKDSGSNRQEADKRPAQSRMGTVVNEFPAGVDGGVKNDNAEEKGIDQILRGVRGSVGEEALQWNTRKQPFVQPQKVLQPSMCGQGQCSQKPVATCNPQEVCPPDGCGVRGVQGNGEFGSAPYRQQPCQQRNTEPYDLMRLLSHEMALGEWEEAAQKKICLPCLRRGWQGVKPVPKTLSEAKEIWQSLSDQKKTWIAFRACGREVWPAGPGEQYEWEPPRIATRVKDRVSRLKCLGNAVVPQQVYPILKAIAEAENDTTQ